MEETLNSQEDITHLCHYYPRTGMMPREGGDHDSKDRNYEWILRHGFPLRNQSTTNLGNTLGTALGSQTFIYSTLLSFFSPF